MELKQEDHEFEANLCYTAKHCLTFFFFKVHYVYADLEVQNHQDLPTVTPRSRIRLEGISTIWTQNT